MTKKKNKKEVSQFDTLLNVHKKILAEELAKKEHDVEMQTAEGWVAVADENKIAKAEFEIKRIQKLIDNEQNNG